MSIITEKKASLKVFDKAIENFLKVDVMVQEN